LNEQIGFVELKKYIFNNYNDNYLVISGIMDRNFHIKKKGYNLIQAYLSKKKYLIDNFNLLLGILATLAYGYPNIKYERAIKIIILKNKTLILNNIDKLNFIVKNSFNMEEFYKLNKIINKPYNIKILFCNIHVTILCIKLTKFYHLNIIFCIFRG
jgi:hypothetical protein